MSTTKHEASREARWYMVDKDGAATLCVDEEDAKECAAHAFVAFPHMGPHRAVQLVEASTAGFTAADMASASAQGFRDGVASLAASAGSEPVAIREAIAHFRLTHWADEDGGLGLADALSQLYGDDDIGRANEELDALADAIFEVVTHPSPPEGMVGGWMPIETAPKDGTAILLGSRGGSWIGKWLPVYGSGYRPENPWSSLMLNHDHMGEKWCKPTHWMPLTPPTTSSADSRKGE